MARLFRLKEKVVATANKVDACIEAVITAEAQLQLSKQIFVGRSRAQQAPQTDAKKKVTSKRTPFPLSNDQAVRIKKVHKTESAAEQIDTDTSVEEFRLYHILIDHPHTTLKGSDT